MTKKDEEKMAFHTDEGVFCYTKMPFGLKNVGATYQRLVDTIFEGQIRRNLEAYVDDMVIKSKTELEIIKDVEETLLTLKKVNMKLNPKKCSFKMEEGKVLGYIVTSEGIRENPKKAKTVVNMPSPSTLKQMQRLSGKLAALNRFLSKASKKALPCLDTLKKCVMRSEPSLELRRSCDEGPSTEGTKLNSTFITAEVAFTKPKQPIFEREAPESETSVLITKRDAANGLLIRLIIKPLVARSASYPLEGIHVDDKLQFVEEPVEIMEREIKRLKRSRIPLVKVRWNSRRGPEFTWEREDSFK
ncbi:reverse transcriptase domain-containing protein [Tanacetum coccineum]